MMTGQKLNAMELLTALTQVAHETSCTLFTLCVNPEGKWKMYIYQSKVIIIGTFAEVATAAIAHIKDNRELLTAKTKKHQFNTHRKYRYTAKPQAAVTSYQDEYSLYTQKLNYAKSLGFANFADCLAKMGAYAFGQGFKNYSNI